MSTRANQRPRIWIADDSPIERAITERALGVDYEYETFADGSLVLERLAAGARQPDVLLLDWVMPAVSGDEVVRFLRSQPATREMQVILVTASRIETGDVVEGLTAGANDYVARPFVAEELRARVENAIRAKRLREQAQRERTRLALIGKLGRAFMSVGPRPTAIVDALAACLVEGLCDGVSLAIAPGLLPGITLARHRSRLDDSLLERFALMDPCTHTFASDDEARAKLPAPYHPAIARFGMSALAVMPFPARSPVAGMVTVMRDRGGTPFTPDDLIALQTCLEYAMIAFENVLRSDAERAVRVQLQTILEHLPLSIVVADRGGNLTHMNQIALEQLPPLRWHHALEKLEGKVEMRAPTGEGIPLADSPLSRALRGETTRGLELELTVDGAPDRTVRASAVPLRDARGAIDSAVLAFDDVTAEKQALAERERAAEFQRYVLGIVSHDLRSPLQTMMMGCEGIALIASDQPKITTTIRRMKTAGQRMHGIIEQLLDVVRTQMGGGIPVEPVEVNLDNIVTSVLGELSLAYPDARFAPHLDNVKGMWDAGRIAQVVTNIVGNAVQHGLHDVPIVVETERAGGDALFRVRNASKAPLTAEQIETLFTPFRRTKRASGGSGLGLGLYISREILLAHHGEISVAADSTTTTFTVRLPLSA
jgi:signal transduction histidine kinase/CheY-like chemotaxis protein